MQPRRLLGDSRAGLSYAGSRNDVTTVQRWHLKLAAGVGCERKAVFGDSAARRFRDIRPDIDHRSLRENLLAIDLSGTKCVNRLCGCNREVHAVELGLMAVIPALEPDR